MSWPNHSERDHEDSPKPRRAHTIMSAKDVAAGKKSSWPKLELVGPVCNLSPNLFKMKHLTYLFMNSIHLSHLPPAIADLCCLTHLDLSCNQLQSLPAELGDVITLRELLINNNFIRELPNELGKLFRVYNLGLSGNPLPPDIYNIYNKPNGTQNLLSHLLNSLPVLNNQPPRRPWIMDIHHNTTSSCVFTVMCYNILCDKLATRQLYGYCPDWALEWKYRRKGIMSEIRHYNADIITLQEVETAQFYSFFLPSLRRDGYDGIFAAKSRAKTMGDSEKQQVDGCAIFYKVSKFSLLKQHVVEFNQIAMASAEKGSDNMLNRVMTKDNISLIALLFTKGGAFDDGIMPATSQVNQPLLVCTPHIHWDPEYCDVKLIQMMMLMRELKSVVDDAINVFQPNCAKHDANNIPLVLCGDFNSLPESGVIEFLKTGSVPLDHSDFKQLAYRDSLQRLGYSAEKNKYHHPFQISCAYDNDMPYTNFTCDFRGVIDYIFSSEHHLKLVGLLGPVDPEWMKENKVYGCPHPNIPSDHFPLLVQLELSPIQVTRSPVSNGVTIRR